MLLGADCHWLVSKNHKSWAARVGRVAWRNLFVVFELFLKRTLLTKNVFWKGAQQTLSLPSAPAEGLQVHFSMGASTMPRRQTKSVPASMF